MLCQEGVAKTTGRDYQAAGVVLGWDGSKPVPWDGDHDPPARGVGAASPDRSFGGEGLIRPVLVVHPLHHHPVVAGVALLSML